jgi:hypothetical protein
MDPEALDICREFQWAVTEDKIENRALLEPGRSISLSRAVMKLTR